MNMRYLSDSSYKEFTLRQVDQSYWRVMYQAMRCAAMYGWGDYRTRRYVWLARQRDYAAQFPQFA